MQSGTGFHNALIIAQNGRGARRFLLRELAKDRQETAREGLPLADHSSALPALREDRAVEAVITYVRHAVDGALGHVDTQTTNAGIID